MADVTAKFTLKNDNLNASFDLAEENTVDAIFKIDAAGTTWGSIDGTLSNQTDLQAALDLKADKSTVQADLEALNDTITENYDTLDNKIDSVNTSLSSDISALDTKVNTVQSDLSGDISALTQTVTSNNTAVNNRIDTTNTNLSNLQTTVNNNYTTITNRINTLEVSTDADIEELNTQLSDLADSVADNYSDFNGKITTLSGTVTNNYTTLDNKINTVQANLSGDVSSISDDLGALSQTVTNNYSTLDSKIDEVNSALEGDINTLETTVNSNYTTLDTKIDNSVSELEGDITTLSGTVTSNYNDLSGSITSNVSTLNNRIDSEVSTLNTSITSEATARENADNALQSQIDAITAASDVVDIVGTYAALQAYDTSNLQNNDIIKVLSDESRNDETTYYRWIITNGVGAWSFIGEEGPYYTKSEADSTFVPQSRTINGKALTDNIILSADDINALPDSTTIGEGILTLQKNGVALDSFGANATINKSINIEVPTTTSELTNNSGFITNAALTGYATTSDLSSGLAGKQNTLTAGSNIQINGNTISATDTTYTAGTGINITNGVISSTATSAAWGDITGTLSNQADLQSALNNKLDLSGGTMTGDLNFIGEEDELQTYVGGGHIETNNYNSQIELGQNLTYNYSLEDNSSYLQMSDRTFYLQFGAQGSQSYFETDVNSFSYSFNNYDIGEFKTEAYFPNSTDLVYNFSVSDNDNTYEVKLSTADGVLHIPTPTQDYANVTNDTAITAEWLKTNAMPLKQDALVSGTNIKTINGQSVLGNGNLQTPYRNIGEIVPSSLPLTDAGLHLLDGALINGSGIYSDFVTKIAGIVTDYPNLFVTEANWQSSVSTYGVCGKFVYDSDNNTVRLPKITGIVEGTTDVTALGDLVQAGLPNITGVIDYPRAGTPSGAFAFGGNREYTTGGGKGATFDYANFNASRSSSIYGNSSTVQPQTIKCYYYIVIATQSKTDIQADIDNIATDLNGKCDVDGTNATFPHITETYRNGTDGYIIYSNGLCEQWGYLYLTGAAGVMNYTVTLLEPYKDYNYSIQLTSGVGSSGWQYANGVCIGNTGNVSQSGFASATGFTINNSAGVGNVAIHWRTIGYIS